MDQKETLDQIGGNSSHWAELSAKIVCHMYSDTEPQILTQPILAKNLEDSHLNQASLDEHHGSVSTPVHVGRPSHHRILQVMAAAVGL